VISWCVDRIESNRHVSAADETVPRRLRAVPLTLEQARTHLRIDRYSVAFVCGGGL
jgi:hypothetical protein